MKSIIKKISAALMSVTLLGAATASNFNSTSETHSCTGCHNHGLTASAAVSAHCRNWQSHNFTFNRWVSPHEQQYVCWTCGSSYIKTTSHSLYRTGSFSDVRNGYVYLYDIYTCGICDWKKAVQTGMYKI